MKAEKMSPCHNLMHQFFAPGHSLHKLCQQLCVAAHVLLWGRMSSSSLVHRSVSNELPASIKLAGKPCKAFHHRTTWRGHGRTAGDDGPSGSSVMTTGRYLQNSQNPAVGRQPGLLLAALDLLILPPCSLVFNISGLYSSLLYTENQSYSVEAWLST